MRSHLLAASLVLAGTAAANAYEHKDEVNTFATAMAVAQVASLRCPNIVAWADAPRELANQFHITTADDMAVQIEIRGYTKSFLDQAGKEPKAWCDEVLERFGQEGTLMRGLLKRE